ncbi:MAG: transcription-repair coupling factor [Deltaproteobacteria bacterium]|nr:transcription-repair coupling factor [Candidatus Zymogenaceae bacterium]
MMKPQDLIGIDKLILRLGNLSPGGRPLKVGGLAGSSAQFLAIRTAKALSRPVLYVTPGRRFEDISANLEFNADGSGPSYHPFPTWDFAPYERLVPQAETSHQRIDTLTSLLDISAPFVAAAPITALIMRVMSKSALSRHCFELSVGSVVSPADLSKGLLESGYMQTGLVVMPGSFSIRGGIVDLFIPGRGSPVRVEFFGDEIESLRPFDPLSQRSVDSINRVKIVPASELLLDDESKSRGMRWIRFFSGQHHSSLKRVRELIQSIEGYQVPAGLAMQFPAFMDGSDTLLDYLPDDTLIFLDEPETISAEIEQYLAAAHRNYDRAIQRKDPSLPPEELFIHHDEWEEYTHRASLLEINPIITDARDGTLSVDIADHRAIREHVGKTVRGESVLTPLALKITGDLTDSKRIALVCLTETQGRRMARLLADHDIHMPVSTLSFCEWLAADEPASILVGGLREGFEETSGRIVVITEEEIFGAKMKGKPPRRPEAGEALTPSDPLSPGDYVVHSRFGIGLFRGLVNLTVMDIIADFLHLEYADGDKLYIPVNNISLVHRFRGGEDSRPRLDKLGSDAWERSRKKVRREVMEMAAELARLYAARKALPGHAFSFPDSAFSEFEASFPYTETPDQLAVMEDIIRDMTCTEPMNRLVAGDVGYGKTEVAMRAAFLAVMDGTQVAVIAPTTILAEQHYLTFQERFSDYPVTIGMLSRFLSPKEQKQTVSDINQGKTDIIIGTHRLLSKDIVFPNLGLLIVDEEHRFGVAHKEKLLHLKTQLDVLSMTATPIPRTLSMSLAGLRDLSIINTPPPNRLSVKTYISEFDSDVIKEAVLRELDRGGQVFFVHNRIRTIDGIRHHLEKILPGVRIGTAHGQMAEDELERVMIEFIDHELDILVSTAIIESGLDIPTANTIIINRADMFGLAQLYQMRGRVGRSHLRAYAYLLVPGAQTITDDARKRLSAISRFTELGSGFKIASHDLEIRGAGNLLGRDQSGHINAVGFDLYMEMVQEAIQSIKGEHEQIHIEPEINLPVTAYIPESYIPDSQQRLIMYRRLINAGDDAELNDITTEISDRFGPMPEEMIKIIDLMEIRRRAAHCGIITLGYQNKTVHAAFHPDIVLDTNRLVDLVEEHPTLYRITPTGVLFYSLDGTEQNGLLPAVKNLLQRLSGYVIS